MLDMNSKPAILADEIGVHFLRSGRNDIVVEWSEIEQVCALRQRNPDLTEWIEVFIDHLSGVDFTFLSVESGYVQVMAAMERHLNGFSRARLEAVGTLDEEENFPVVVWRCDPGAPPT
jgi:hypothetical protein